MSASALATRINGEAAEMDDGEDRKTRVFRLWYNSNEGFWKYD
jgi:hypothetical protein